MNAQNNILLQIDPQWEQQIDGDRLTRAADHVLQREGVPEGASMTLVVAAEDEVIRLNHFYREEVGTTDVLTFPYEDMGVDEEMEVYLGDVVLCFEQAARQAEEQGHSTGEELVLLTVHGTLHLLGYDDETPSEKREMWTRQHQLMEQLGVVRVAPQEDRQGGKDS